MKRFLFIIGVLLLVASNMYFIIKQVYKEYVLGDESVGGYSQEYVTSNVIGMDMLLRNGGLPLDTAIVFKTDDTSCDFFTDGAKRYLVCRISQYDCESCTEYALEKMASICSDDFGAKALVLANYQSGNNIELIRLRHSGADQISYLRMEDAYLPAEQAGMPYYFILDENMKINDVFFPDRLFPEMTSRYFEKLREKYNLMDGRS